MLARETNLASGSSPGSRRGSRVLGILITIGVKKLKEADLSPRREMEVRYSVQKSTIISVVVLTMESAEIALIPALVAVRVGIWLDSAHITEVRLEVMLSLGLNHRVQKQPSLIRGTSSIL